METGASGGAEVTERERDSSFHGFKHMFLTRADRRGFSQTETSLEVRLGR